MTRVAAVGLVLAATLSPPQDPPSLELDDVLEAAVTYVAKYETDLQYLIAEERYEQRRFDLMDRELAKRVTTGEFFLTYVGSEREWLGVRDVARVDGEAVDRQPLNDLLGAGSLRRIGPAVAARNARWNIGIIERNFNVPTMALAILTDEHRKRFRFDRERITRSALGTVVTVSFRERDRPTLVHGSYGPIYATGELDIEPGTGVIRRTMLELENGPIAATLTTEYQPNARFNLWLPALMSERYFSSHPDRRERIDAAARYSNYRRFSTSVVIKSP